MCESGGVAFAFGSDEGRDSRGNIVGGLHSQDGRQETMNIPWRYILAKYC